MATVWPDVSGSYLSNVVQRLTRGRLLRSHRGITGGYSLGRAAAKISLRDLVELLEGVDHNRCGLSLEGVCPSSETVFDPKEAEKVGRGIPAVVRADDHRRAVGRRRREYA